MDNRDQRRDDYRRRGDNGDDPKGGKKDDMNKKSLLIMVAIALTFMVIFQLVAGEMDSSSKSEVTYTEFTQMVKERKVEEASFETDRIMFKLKNDDKSYYTGLVAD